MKSVEEGITSGKEEDVVVVEVEEVDKEEPEDMDEDPKVVDGSIPDC